MRHAPSYETLISGKTIRDLSRNMHLFNESFKINELILINTIFFHFSGEHMGKTETRILSMHITPRRWEDEVIFCVV